MSNIETISCNTCPQDASSQFHLPSRFFFVRTLSLGLIFFLGFVWSILLCVAIFVRWDKMNIVERTMISIMLFVEVLTIIVVPVLLAREFRLWLDAARSLFLFASHVGIAVWFACRLQSMKCVGDEQSVCTSLVLSILILSWAIPILVILYSCVLGYLYYCLSKLKHSKSTVTTPTTTLGSTSNMAYANSDAEKQRKTVSHASSFYTTWHVSQVSSGYAV